MHRSPPAEINITATLVQNLLDEQHPDLAHLPIQSVDAGWDNAMFRLGDRLAVRLPRRRIAAKFIAKEQTWLPAIAPQLTLPVPSSLRTGRPTQAYPWCWSVLPWLTGTAADQAEPHADQAEVFASFLRSLHTLAPANAPFNEFRSVPLSQKRDAIEARLQRLQAKTTLITPSIYAVWESALAATIDVAPTWIHGDLHPRNVLVQDGAIAGIIDWGDMASGDIATDLASVWMLFAQSETRRRAIAAYGNVSEATVRRAKGWAIFWGTVLLATGLADNPRHAIIGTKILRYIAQA